MNITKNNNLVVNCKTKKEVDEFLMLCEKNNIFVKKSLKKWAWKEYGEDVCFRFDNYIGELFYGNIEFYSGRYCYEQLCEIVDYSPKLFFDKSDELKDEDDYIEITISEIEKLLGCKVKLVG